MQPGARRPDRTGSSDPAYVLRAGRRRARRQPPAALTEHARPLDASRTATRSSSSRPASAPASTREVRLDLPRNVAVAGPSGAGLRTTRQIGWTVPPGSTLRLQQLLAQAGYLPLDWTPAGAPVPRTPQAELQAAVDPPKGHFSWRYPNTPHELQALWSEGSSNEITRGAVMMFQDTHKLAVDAIPGREGLARAARRRDRGQAPRRRLQLRLRAQQRPAVADALAQRPDGAHLARATPACPPPRRSSARSRSSSTSRWAR